MIGDEMSLPMRVAEYVMFITSRWRFFLNRIPLPAGLYGRLNQLRNFASVGYAGAATFLDLIACLGWTSCAAAPCVRSL